MYLVLFCLSVFLISFFFDAYSVVLRNFKRRLEIKTIVSCIGYPRLRPASIFSSCQTISEKPLSSKEHPFIRHCFSWEISNINVKIITWWIDFGPKKASAFLFSLQIPLLFFSLSFNLHGIKFRPENIWLMFLGTSFDMPSLATRDSSCPEGLLSESKNIQLYLNKL